MLKMPARQSKDSNPSKYKEKRLLLDRGEDRVQWIRVLDKTKVSVGVFEQVK